MASSPLPPEVRNLLGGHAMILRALHLDTPKKLKAHPPSEDCVCLSCELANAVREGREALECNPDAENYDQVQHDALLVLVCLLEQNKYKPA
jgi:hypothetical protein